MNTSQSSPLGGNISSQPKNMSAKNASLSPEAPFSATQEELPTNATILSEKVTEPIISTSNATANESPSETAPLVSPEELGCPDGIPPSSNGLCSDGSQPQSEALNATAADLVTQQPVCADGIATIQPPASVLTVHNHNHSMPQLAVTTPEQQLVCADGDRTRSNHRPLC